MKSAPPELDPRAPARQPARDKDDPRLWHPSVIEFSKGVEVCEDTLPAELWDLFGPQDGSSGGTPR